MSLLETFKFQSFFTVFMRLIGELSSCLSPLLTRELIKFVEHKSGGHSNLSSGKGVGYAIGVSIMVFLTGFCMSHYFNSGGEVGAAMHAALSKLMYDKSFRLSKKSKATTHPNGKVITILTQDLVKVDSAATYFYNFFVFPVSFSITIILLCVNIGAVALIGIATFFFGLSVVIVISLFLKPLRIQATKFTDLRVSLIKEVLSNLKMIKLYSWEDSYLAKIKSYRFNEMKCLVKMHYIKSFMTTFSLILPQLSSVITFIAMYNIDGMKSVANMFTTISFFMVLFSQSFMIPMAAASSVDASLALQRVTEMLLLDEEEELDWVVDHGMKILANTGPNSNLALTVTDGEFTWTYDEANDDHLVDPFTSTPEFNWFR
ncbi:unnamed protein product [Ambrosiozyma monospora]|uniref:Unnamed protein product n=1 Tax=Ambrosiozyma monospora TaxID=43982 RepID=A0ACB5TXR5_AMBMO|nr:unnamed protein product [Ambrosiozyma monospora]